MLENRTRFCFFRKFDLHLNPKVNAQEFLHAINQSSHVTCHSLHLYARFGASYIALESKIA